MELLVFILFVWLVVLSLHLGKVKKRLWLVEKQLGKPVPATTANSAPAPVVEAPHMPDIAVPAPPAMDSFVTPVVPKPLAVVEPPIASTPRRQPLEAPLAPASPLMDFVRRNAFAVAGVVLVLLGFAYLLSSIEWGNLLPPAAKIGLAWVASAGLAGLGIRLGQRNALWGQIVQGGAASVAYLSTYVASARFSVLPEPVALGAFALISGWTVYRALKEDAKILAAVGFLGAYAAPVLALTQHASLAFTLAYGLITTAAALWVSLQRKWLELAVHAHVCAAGMAVLVFSQRHDALPLLLQQGLLNAYFLQFTAWVVAWSSRKDSSAGQTSALSACLGLSAVSYLGLQYWLLSSTAFSLVTVVAALAIGASLLRWPNALEKGTREAFWMVAALFGASAITGADSAKGFQGLALYAEAALMLLTAGPSVRIRLWLARVLAIVGVVGVLGSHSGWVHGIFLFASIPLAFALSAKSRNADAWGAAVFGVLSAVGLAESLANLAGRSSQTTDALLTSTWLTVLAAIVAAGAAGLASRAAGWKPARVYHGFLGLAWLLSALMLFKDDTSVLVAAVQCAVLVFIPVAAMAISQFLSKGALRKKDANLQMGLSIVCALLPAIVAYKSMAAWPTVWAWIAASVATWVALSRYVLESRTTFQLSSIGVSAQYHMERVALAAACLAFVPLKSSAMLGSSKLGTVAVLISALAGIAVWASGTRSRQPTARWTIGAFVASLLLLVWSYSWTYPVLHNAWPVTLAGMPLPMIWGVLAVGLLVFFSRKGDRTGWQVAAGGCALATVKLLLVVGNALLSPLGVALGLLGMGGLLLLAGYVAPQPPAPQDDGKSEQA